MVRNTLALAGLGGDNYYLRMTADAAVYHMLAEDFIVSLSASAGAVGAYNGTTLRLSNRFFVGGDSFAGWAAGGIGPRDSNTGDSLGGKYYYTGIGELSFPLGLPKELGFVGKAFVDVGSLWGAVETSNVLDVPSLRVATGVGIQWVSPFGPIRVDYTFPLADQSYDRRQSIRFNIGARF